MRGLHSAHAISTPFLILLLIVSLCLYGLITHTTPKAWSQTGSSLIGYLWSDTIGWVDLNCLNSNSCGTNPFGMSIDGSGNITGYAWSDNIGWISANPSDLTGCPSAPCTATFNGTTLSGWFRALAGGTAQSGGWDGFINITGISYASSTNYFSGYGWGNLNTGWVDFSRARESCPVSYSCNGNQVMQTNSMCQISVYGSACASPQFCSSGVSTCLYPQPSGSITVSPKLIVKNKTTNVTWSATGVSTTTPCTVTNTNDATVWTGNSGTKTSLSLQAQTIFTLSCTPYDPNATNPYKVTATVNLAPNFVEQ